MKEVIRITGLRTPNIGPVKFTHLQTPNGWKKTVLYPTDFDSVVYLGFCSSDGDMFACYTGTTIGIFKGCLNSGKY